MDWNKFEKEHGTVLLNKVFNNALLKILLDKKLIKIEDFNSILEEEGIRFEQMIKDQESQKNENKS